MVKKIVTVDSKNNLPDVVGATKNSRLAPSILAMPPAKLGLMSNSDVPPGAVIAMYSNEALSNSNPLALALENPTTAQVTSPGLKTAGGTLEVAMAKITPGPNVITIIAGFNTFSSQYSIELSQIMGETPTTYQRKPISSEDRGFLEVFYPEEGTAYKISIKSLVDNPDDFYALQLDAGQYREVISVENVTTSLEDVSNNYLRRNAALSLHTVGGLPLDPRDIYVSFTNGSPSMSGDVKKDQFNLGLNYSFSADGSLISGGATKVEGSFAVSIGSSLLSDPVVAKIDDVVTSFPVLERSSVVRIRFSEDILKYPENEYPILTEVSIDKFFVLA